MKFVRLKYVFIIAAMLLPMLCQAQVKISTKRARLSDFPVKTTKVVLTGDDLTDLTLTGDVISRWRISPFEFCDRKYFDSNRYESGFYYLYLSSEKNGITYLNLYKSGRKNASMSTDGCLNVMKIATDRDNLAIALDILQRYVDGVILNETATVSEPYVYNGRLFRNRNRKIFIAKDDLSLDYPGRDSVENCGNGIIFADEELMERIREHDTGNNMIAICIKSPSDAKRATCIRMIVTADSHELCYYREHRTRNLNAVGFREKDVKRIRMEHKYKNNDKRQN